MYKIDELEAVHEIHRQAEKWFNGIKSGDEAMDNVVDILFRHGLTVERIR